MKLFSKTLALALMMIISMGTTFAGTMDHDGNNSLNLKVSLSQGKKVQAGDILVAAIDIQAPTTTMATILDGTGKVVLNTPVTLEAGQSQLRVKLGEIPSGVYFLKINAAGHSETQSFYVQ